MLTSEYHRTYVECSPLCCINDNNKTEFPLSDKKCVRAAEKMNFQTVKNKANQPSRDV